MTHPTFSEIVIPDNGRDYVELWAIRDVKGLWPTKIAAEAFARAVFPEEGPDQRYGRISYVTFHKEPT